MDCNLWRRKEYAISFEVMWMYFAKDTEKSMILGRYLSVDWSSASAKLEQNLFEACQYTKRSLYFL